jgi:hypothetical protein
MIPAVWANWTPQKCNNFSWLILKNRVWTTDRIVRGWPNCGPCQLCKIELVSAAHIIFKCRYSIRVWKGIKDWLGLVDLDTDLWANFTPFVSGNVQSPVHMVGIGRVLHLCFFSLLWSIGTKEMRVFINVASMPAVVISTIKSSAAL